jgi:Fe-S-cluster-containing dehydrogenase component
LIDEELCTGCKDCIEACPLEVMQFDRGRKVAQKCDLCVDRLDAGLQPACVASCPSHCIYFGDISEVVEKIGENSLLVRYKGVAG